MVMEIIEQLKEVLTAGIYAGVLWAAAYLAQWAKSFLKNKERKSCCEELDSAVAAAVAQTNQCYVDKLKQAGVFTEECQKEAFELAKKATLGALTSTCKRFFEKNCADMTALLGAKLEEAVRKEVGK